MTAIDPFADVRLPTTTTPPVRNTNDQFGKDTFLKLLVAQLRFQNPMSPADPGDFLAQSAQFTMVEKLAEIEKASVEARKSNEVLAASAMIGRTVTFGTLTGEPTTPIATSEIGIGGNLPASAATAASFETTTDVYTNDGAKVPLKFQFVRAADAPEGGGTQWDMRVLVGTQQIGASTVTFDTNGERTSGDVGVSMGALETIVGTAGKWPAEGITFKLGALTDPARLRVGTGAATPTVREQNGSDGNTLTGIVTGIRFTEDGAVLRVGNRDIPMASVLEVHPTAV
ncbi:MAG: flagellar hook capping FlgD N-terminal domain-containing protein [Actinomycetota bacterium]|nr:flagellar hook capping FlgD N-terminal domain-containing protein [Actinomycetota bacterium]